jgi:hypothetical protein
MMYRVHSERTRFRPARLLARALAGWLALSLALSLAPCCDLVADIFSIRQAQAAEPAHAHPDGTGHEHVPSGQPDPCQSWLEQLSPVLPVALPFGLDLQSEAAFSATLDARVTPPPRLLRLLPRAPPLRRSPPLYLRFVRLLI